MRYATIFGIVSLSVVRIFFSLSFSLSSIYLFLSKFGGSSRSRREFNVDGGSSALQTRELANGPYEFLQNYKMALGLVSFFLFFFWFLGRTRGRKTREILGEWETMRTRMTYDHTATLKWTNGWMYGWWPGHEMKNNRMHLMSDCLLCSYYGHLSYR